MFEGNVISISQMRNQNLTENVWFTQGHPQNLNSDPVPSSSTDDKCFWLPRFAVAVLCIPLVLPLCSLPGLCNLDFSRKKRPNHRFTQWFYIATSYHNWDPLWGQNCVLVPLAAPCNMWYRALHRWAQYLLTELTWPYFISCKSEVWIKPKPVP